MAFEQKQFPDGWAKTRISHICELIGGGTPSRKNPEYFDGGTIWLTPTEIPKNSIVEISDSREKITELGLRKSSAKIIPKSSVLLTSRASIGYVAIAGADLTTNQGFASFVCSSVVHNFYLAYWLTSKKNLLEKEATGTTFKEISKSKLRMLDILLPPLGEQKRIVSKIESIFARIDACRGELERLASRTSSASGSLAQLRASVLKQAFEGRLVPQDPDDESAEVLLKKVNEDSEGLVLENDDLPAGWVRTTVEYCTDILDGKRIPVNSTERDKRKGDIPYYGATGQVGWIDDHLFDEELVLLGEDGAPFLTHSKNKAYMISGKSWVNNHAHVLRAKSEITLNAFLCHCLNVFDYRGFVSGTTRLKLNQKSMRQIPIPLPPLNEQRRIVSRLESIFSGIDAVHIGKYGHKMIQNINYRFMSVIQMSVP